MLAGLCVIGGSQETRGICRVAARPPRRRGHHDRTAGRQRDAADRAFLENQPARRARCFSGTTTVTRNPYWTLREPSARAAASSAWPRLAMPRMGAGSSRTAWAHGIWRTSCYCCRNTACNPILQPPRPDAGLRARRVLGSAAGDEARAHMLDVVQRFVRAWAPSGHAVARDAARESRLVVHSCPLRRHRVSAESGPPEMPQPGPDLEGFVQARHFADPDRFPPHLLGGYKDSLSIAFASWSARRVRCWLATS
jgi:hypothetical protein